MCSAGLYIKTIDSKKQGVNLNLRLQEMHDELSVFSFEQGSELICNH